MSGVEIDSIIVADKGCLKVLTYGPVIVQWLVELPNSKFTIDLAPFRGSFWKNLCPYPGISLFFKTVSDFVLGERSSPSLLYVVSRQGLPFFSERFNSMLVVLPSSFVLRYLFLFQFVPSCPCSDGIKSHVVDWQFVVDLLYINELHNSIRKAGISRLRHFVKFLVWSTSYELQFWLEVPCLFASSLVPRGRSVGRRETNRRPARLVQ